MTPEIELHSQKVRPEVAKKIAEIAIFDRSENTPMKINLLYNILCIKRAFWGFIWGVFCKMVKR